MNTPRRKRRKKGSCFTVIICNILICISLLCILNNTNNKTNTFNQETEASVDIETSITEDTVVSSTNDDIDTQINSIAASNHDTIQAKIDTIADAYGAIGMQVAVIENGVVTDSFAYGWATINETPMTTTHKIRVASISKVLIGITAMLLQENQVIDLDADIGNYWNTAVCNPYYPNSSVTIRSMLTHTSSIICYGDDYSVNYNSVLQRLSYGFSDLEPGNIDSWWYNNYAFRVLGMTLELASNNSIDNILYENLFNEMEIDASFASGDINDTNLLVTLYRENGEVARSIETQLNLHISDTPGSDGSFFAGGLTISSEDLAKIVALLAADGQYNGIQLLNQASVELMESYIPQQLSDGSYQAVPLFYWPSLYGRDGIYYHTGSAYGVYNCVSYDPATGDGVVVLTTGANGAVDQYGISMICSEINSYLYNLLSQ